MASLLNLNLLTFIFSRDNLPIMKDEAYVISLDDKQSRGTHWVSLFVYRNEAVYFDSLEIEYIPQKVLKKIKCKSITRNIFRIQSNVSIISTFIEYMISGKTLLDYTNLFTLFDYQKNDKTIYKYFQEKFAKGKGKSWF